MELLHLDFYMQNNTNWLQFEIKQEAINSRQFAELNVNDTLFEKKKLFTCIFTSIDLPWWLGKCKVPAYNAEVS